MFVGIVALYVICCIPKGSFMRNPDTGSLIEGSTLMNAIIPLFTLLFFIPSFVYGKLCGSFKSDKDVVASFNKSIASISGFIAMAFVAAQFTNYFSKTNIGRILSFKGAELLQSLNINSVGLMMCFILVAGFVNLFMASASAKYAIFDKDTGWGTLVSSMLPYSMAFLVSWAAMLALWMIFNLPLGPGAPVFYTIG